MDRRAALTLAAFALIVTAALAAACGIADAADLQRGAALARQWCANCHVIGAEAPGAVQQGPPAFRTVAGTPPDQLRTFLTRPHGAMPDLSLSRAEIDDLVAYIGTVK